MQYIKATFTLDPDNEVNREILTAYLSELDFESFDESDEKLNAFYPVGKVSGQAIGQILEQLPFEVSVTEEEMPDINWNEEWEKNYFQPLLIGNDCLIRAPFHTEYPKVDYEIVIEPNMAFGTGNHETTSLMIEHIRELNMEGETVLDMGCGTGILGIFASMRGCQSVTAIDIDAWAFESVVENCRLNNINNMEAFIGDASLLGNKQYDVILANIQKNIIMQDIEKYNSVLKDGGILIVSGFYKDDLEDILARASELFLRKLEIKEKNNWIACAFEK
ncbi:50S ribosomal protein L11 methyltransferase [Mangrovibacterium marinum]|uniref:Ribosomal protein L11 methyltransferase n=1 Tax=Mangrovibacterium marinum TaxID=1639118 RepID=A0A2T5BZQ7_9BACT|nr:50S ribosomal protein L11 methyltransferase [Mangrovibacterium marinum]PTN07781.1 ribosomal protein L11 methyltransferase [Mangrovibacterium marinum]